MAIEAKVSSVSDWIVCDEMALQVGVKRTAADVLSEALDNKPGWRGRAREVLGLPAISTGIKRSSVHVECEGCIGVIKPSANAQMGRSRKRPGKTAAWCRRCYDNGTMGRYVNPER